LMLDNAIETGKSLREDSVKLYKGVKWNISFFTIIFIMEMFF
jgi:hypothetical protein